jgi:hypothetical protein
MINRDVIYVSGDAGRPRPVGYGVAGIPGRRLDGISGVSITLKGQMYPGAIERIMNMTRCACPEDMEYHATNCPYFPGQPMGATTEETETTRDIAQRFLEDMNMVPTEDAVSQLVEVFIPCLRIMCERPWDPNGKTWRKSGIFGVLSDGRKKWERFWERFWVHGKRHDDSALDLINYVGFVLRSDDNRWGEWGEPAAPEGNDD